MDRLAGLCGSCNHVLGCMYLREPRPPVWRCDDFEDETAAPRSFAPRQPTPLPVVPDTAAVAGLCGNCIERSGCTLPKNPGGVWHCEEYR